MYLSLNVNISLPGMSSVSCHLNELTTDDPISMIRKGITIIIILRIFYFIYATENRSESIILDRSRLSRTVRDIMAVLLNVIP